jgi:RING finger protein 121/175
MHLFLETIHIAMATVLTLLLAAAGASAADIANSNTNAAIIHPTEVHHGLAHNVVSSNGSRSNDTHNPLTDSDDTRLDSTYAIFVFYSFMFLMLGAQTGLFMWKKKNKRSYDLITLVGLWLVPAAFSAQLHFWMFLIVWFLYSLVTGFLIYKCTKKKMNSTTPRLVYGWFLATHRISVFIGAVGYFALLLDMLGAGQMLYPKSTAITMLWYGIYFGVLGRDTAEVASDQMASSMAYGRSLTNTVTNCGICRNEMKDLSHMGQDVKGAEKVVQLSCKHCFHDLCVRGWTMVGKKDICPVCNEKVDLRNLYSDRPWETGNLSWIQMLDMFRYLVVWMPVIFAGFSVVVHVLGLAAHPQQAADGHGHNATLPHSGGADALHHHQNHHLLAQGLSPALSPAHHAHVAHVR